MTLKAIGGGFQLEQGAALSRLRAWTAGCPWVITTAYRDRAYQQRLYDGWIARLPGYNFALPPGTSKHELGLAVDVDWTTAQWLVTHGAEYGWARPKGWTEWWHFEYFINEDKHTKETDMATPQELWGYKNGSGTPDALQRLANAEMHAREANAKIDALAKSIKVPTVNVSIDYAKLAKAVNDDAARRMAQ